METPKFDMSALQLVDSGPPVSHGSRLDGDLSDAPLYACSGIPAPYRILRLVKSSTPVAPTVEGDSDA